MIVLIPIDLALTIVGRRSQHEEHVYDTSAAAVIALYNSVYIPMLLLSSVVLTVQEEYNRDGHFTGTARFCSAFKDAM